MKEFMIKHPIITFASMFLICTTIADCVCMIVTHKKPEPTFHINLGSKGEQKGA